jgi:hypothetical protein
MIKLTVWIAVILIILGTGGFLLTGTQSITALIPAVFGLLLLICSLIAGKETRQKLAMHIAQGIALLGLLGSVSGLIKLLMYLMGSGVLERPSAVVAQSIMALLCLIYLIFGIRSFIAARRSAAGGE